MAGIRNRAELESADPAGRRRLALSLLERAIDAVDPRNATAAVLQRLALRGERLDGSVVIAFGKASRAMAEGALDVCRPREGLVVGFEDGRLGPLVAMASSHPVPTGRSVAAAEAALDLASRVGPEDVVLCLVSGGGSAMLELPASGLSLEALQATTTALLASGADIVETNAVRRALSKVKGGRLAEALAPARVINVVLSDVPGGGPEVVASGPTMAPPAGVDPLAVLAGRGLEARLPAEVVRAVRAGTRPADARAHEHVHVEVAGDNIVARRAMVEEARARGLRAVHLDGFVAGEARAAGARFYAECRRRDADVVVWGGETTVDLRGDGVGGRNQELVLGAFEGFAGGLLASIGTDGVDGSSEAAGALLDDVVVDAARRLGLDAADHLARNDSDGFFARAGGRIVTGRTGTNVADVCVYLA